MSNEESKTFMVHIAAFEALLSGLTILSFETAQIINNKSTQITALNQKKASAKVSAVMPRSRDLQWRDLPMRLLIFVSIQLLKPRSSTHFTEPLPNKKCRLIASSQRKTIYTSTPFQPVVVEWRGILKLYKSKLLRALVVDR